MCWLFTATRRHRRRPSTRLGWSTAGIGKCLLAGRILDAEATFVQGPIVIAPSDEDHRVAVLEQAGADHPTDGSRPVDHESHPSSLARGPRVRGGLVGRRAEVMYVMDRMCTLLN